MVISRYLRALTPSPALAAVVGSAPLPRTEIISKLWVYIKASGGRILNGPMDVPGGSRVLSAADPQGAVFGLHSRKGQ